MSCKRLPSLLTALTLTVAPLTGKVTIKNGPVPLVIPTDDISASERQDRGGAF